MERIAEILSKSVYQRSEIERNEIFEFFCNYEFFNELKSQDESEALFKDCINSLIIENYPNDSLLSSGVYIVLTGSSPDTNINIINT